LHDINYHIPLPEGPCNKIAFIDTAKVEFTTTRPVKMYYTLDGTEPTTGSNKYESSIPVDNTGIVKIRTALASGKLGNVRTINVVKQSPVESVKVNAKNKGLKLKIAQGELYSTNDIKNVSEWEEKIAGDYVTTKQLFNYDNPSVGIFEGYLEIPEDGIYHFSSDMDELYVANKLLINNHGEVKRFSRNDASIALKKGLQPIKIVYINNVYGGWAQAWNGVHIKYKNINDAWFTDLKPENFVY